jgi:hypothetical protein
VVSGARMRAVQAPARRTERRRSGGIYQGERRQGWRRMYMFRFPLKLATFRRKLVEDNVQSRSL